MKRPDGSSNGIELRPIRQITGQSGFTETFITEARAARQRDRRAHNGWRVTMTTLGTSGAATRRPARPVPTPVLAHRRRGAGDPANEPLVRQKLAWAYTRAEIRLRRSAHLVGGRDPQGAGTGGVDQQDVLVRVRAHRRVEMNLREPTP
jgi:hypothetical protein